MTWTGRKTSWHMQAAKLFLCCSPDRRPQKPVHPHDSFNYRGWMWWRSSTLAQWMCGLSDCTCCTNKGHYKETADSNLFHLCVKCVWHDCIKSCPRWTSPASQKDDTLEGRSDKREVLHYPRLAPGSMKLYLCVGGCVHEMKATHMLFARRQVRRKHRGIVDISAFQVKARLQRWDFNCF